MLFPSPELAHKLEVLRAHCAAEGRNYEEIEKTCIFRFDVGAQGEQVGAIVEQLHGLAALGIQGVIGGVKDVWRVTPLDIIGRDIIPAVASF